MIRALFFTVPFVMLLAGNVLAQDKKPDPDLLPADAKGQWRTMSQTGPAESCAGSLRSNVCALETMMACLVRAEDFCRQVIGPDWPVDRFGQPRDADEISTAEALAGTRNSPAFVLKYRFQWSKRVRSEEDMWVRGHITERIPDRKIGDIVVGVTLVRCYQGPSRLSCGTPLDKPAAATNPKHAVQYTLRRRPDGDWYVVHWGAPGY